MTMTSKFPGTCARCGGRFNAGTLIDWSKDTRRASHSGACPVAVVVAPVAVALDLSKVATFIAAAKQRGLKFPKVRFLAPNGGELRLSVAGVKSKFPGSVQVAVDGRWLGRVNVDGTGVGPMVHDAEIITTLTCIGEDPAACAAAYGALMCRCSFCGLALTDDGSVEVGYGPVCAKHYGLPHSPKGVRAVALPGFAFVAAQA